MESIIAKNGSAFYFILFFKEKRMETFEMPFKLGNDAKAALVGEICTCRL